MRFQVICLCMLSLFTHTLIRAQNVEPMIEACFDQSPPFNDLCPHSSAAGCGPVAVAQILSYYKYPAHGIGTVKYVNTEYGDTITENLEELYFDWSDIINEYVPGNYTEREASAVARLIYACGVTMNVAYGLSSSTKNKYRMVYNLQHHMLMSPESRYLNREYYSTPEWIELLNSQLRSGHPVFYRGTAIYKNSPVSHMFVIDGVNEAGLYHVNWGHGGIGNKYADLNVLNQGAEEGLPGGKNVCYNFKQAMMVNCYPVEELKDTPVQWCDLTESITINDDPILNGIEVGTGQPFKLSTSIANCAADTCMVNYKWVLMRDGEEVQSFASGYWDSFPPFLIGKIEKKVSVPPTIPDGDYSMILMTKSSLSPTWQQVRDNPINRVNIAVREGIVTVTVPDQHKGDPELYLSADPSLTYGPNAEYLDILCDLINPTDNNYEGKFKIEVSTDNTTFMYEPDVCVYGYTQVKYRFSIPKSKFDLTSNTVRDVNIWYQYDGQETVLGTTRPNGISNPTAEDGCIFIYSLQGKIIAVIRRDDIQNYYNDVLSSLPAGIFIIKDGNQVRKFVR